MGRKINMCLEELDEEIDFADREQIERMRRNTVNDYQDGYIAGLLKARSIVMRAYKEG